MPAYTQIPTRTNTSVNTLAVDVDTLQNEIDLIKGGTPSAGPTKTLEQVITAQTTDEGNITTAQANIVTLQNTVNTTVNAATGTTQTLTVASLNQDYFPSADHDVNAPTTSVPAGWKRRIYNESTTKVLTFKASGGTVVCKIIPMTWVDFQARQATPTTNAHWKQVDAGGNDHDFGMVAGAIENMGTCNTLVGVIRRRGGYMVGRIKFNSGTMAGSVPSWILPYSLSVATTLLEAHARPGSWRTYASGGNLHYPFVHRAAATKMQFCIRSDGSNWNDDLATTVSGNGEVIAAEFEIPILTWELG